MKSASVWTLAICLPLVLGACSKSKTGLTGESPPLGEVILRPFAEGAPKLVFNYDVSTILGADDAYTLTLSAFDYASKYQSDTPLTPEQRAAAFKQSLHTYSPEEIQTLNEAFKAVFASMKGMTVVLPETIYIFSEETIEAGAAYTRANTICMPRQMLSMSNTDQIRDLAAHEMFHVLSRYNLPLRTPIYATLGFKPVEPLQLSGVLATRTIANPDAPDNNYAITGTLQGETLDFMPILYSKSDFQKNSGSFFHYLNDDLIAVKLENGKSSVIERDRTPLIVKKEQVDGYFEQIGRNTQYTFHPEETSADHFKQLLFRKPETLPNPEKIKALDRILRPQG